MSKQRLLIDQMNAKLKPFEPLAQVVPPPTGWIKAVRTALGISLQQLGNKLAISKQSASEIEQREKDGSITLKSLREAANALEMTLVYGFVPKDGSLDSLIEKKAKALATRIVSRTSNTMKLEDQENSAERIKKAIDQRTDELKREIPKILWD
ncbi:mobile mystery protein A [Marinoscillum furvescens]|uniref:Putative DNA-binding mobile mystery protein A n=1 Tax=Marinoscillum furvescens DSM 4134 TaxID=1122208 RepID=A0A3D9L1I1_MARFU|nr:mobile mystery protein A [Marinoscillum furvescens]RED96678.1 putative DNA-binding mobile mystery protein A [Marinoscillum furvescens DSM 4134]